MTSPHPATVAVAIEAICTAPGVVHIGLLTLFSISAECSSSLESRWVAGVRARHGQGAGRAGAVEAAHESYRDALDTHVRAACVSPPVHERSHGNAHARLSVIAWQAGVWLQRLSHEYILSMNSFSP